jgi:hypothetical protein
LVNEVSGFSYENRQGRDIAPQIQEEFMDNFSAKKTPFAVDRAVLE